MPIFQKDFERYCSDLLKDKKKILLNLEQRKTEDWNWSAGRSFGFVYYLNEAFADLIQEAYKTFFFENPLSKKAFPSLQGLENEIIQAFKPHLSSHIDLYGSFTSGGTESILLSLKAHREVFQRKYEKLFQPEVILPKTAHPAFVKGCHYFDLKPVFIDFDKSFQASLPQINQALSAKTMLLVASCPNFPFGTVDPLEEMSNLAIEKKIGLHLDACLGGLFWPYHQPSAKKGFEKLFDLAGVSSVSLDLHKYGYAPKGSSLIYYRSRELYDANMFSYSGWPVGTFKSDRILGTFSGGAIAGAWVASQFFQQGLHKKAFEEILDIADHFKKAICEIPGFSILGDPPMGIFSFTSSTFAIQNLSVELKKRGWGFNFIEGSQAIQLIINPVHRETYPEFVRNIVEIVKR